MRIFTLIGIVALVVGAFFAYQAWFTPASDSPFDVGKAAAPIIALTFLIIGGVFTVVGTVITRMGSARKQLLAQGLAGRAEIVSVAQTGMYVNEQPQVRMQLNVTVPGRMPYSVSHSEVVPLLALGMITPGHVLPVAVDPTNQNRLAIDWSGDLAARGTQLGVAGVAIGEGLGWTQGVTPTIVQLPNSMGATPQAVAPPNTFEAMPVMPVANTLGSLPGATQSAPAGSVSGVGFAAVGAPGAADGMAAYLNYLRSAGIPGRATVRSAQDTSVAVQGNEVVMVQLDVTPNGGATYPVMMTAIVPMGATARLVPGSSLPVFIDRSNPQAVAIDWNAA